MVSEHRACDKAPSKPSSTAGWIGALTRTSRIGTDPHAILPVVLDEVALRHGDRPALIGAKERLTHRQFATRRRFYAGWARRAGLGHGDTVALLMPNGPDYLAIWLGLIEVGVVVALLNTNLSGAALAHCIAASGARHIVVAKNLAASYAAASPHLSERLAVWLHGTDGDDLRIDGPAEVRQAAPTPPRRPTLADRALLIYTSGTTGLPKAAHVSHHRLVMWSQWFAGLLDTAPSDRMYDCLPLYHSIGGVVAPGSVLVSGGSVVIREKFSASRFWRDVVEEECTLFQYIGELCRFLVNGPPDPLERSHRLRACAGNGLRADVWTRFQDRFAIPQILEFYAATEGTVSLYNVEGKVGAVGRVPPFMAHRSPAAVVRHDVERGEPARDPEGFCTRVATGETGELIGRLADDPAQAALRFEGYTSAGDSARKVLRDVFRAGDAWLRTGDLMRQDEKGFFIFVDRIGDTFRWKGENVSTTEVAAVVGGAPGVVEAAVYGVAVPGLEGRAGMAALAVAPGFDLDAFRAFVAERLPRYACPVFVRLGGDLAVTETFKQKTTALIEQGFNPRGMAEAVYVDDPAAGRYLRIDDSLWEAITAGLLRL